MNRKLKMGMVGGCLSSFIGKVHRMAAALDNEIEFAIFLIVTLYEISIFIF